ncbi:hypothetical protein [Mycobacterium sp. DL99]|uniref:hypothetical protein n=1 Tax=Mycobacterium sp. DL99 TaxID=2528957 RepID=UPI0010820E5B|nr:hypothetical protein [Mycobacterium sp. DL99]
MSILENLSDLAHELKVAVGTGFTMLGSHLESSARARVDASALCAGCGHARADHVELVGECGKRIGPERVPCTCREFVGSVGAQWLTEFEEQRDVVAPGELRAECTCPTEQCELLAEDICDEAEGADESAYTVDDIDIAEEICARSPGWFRAECPCGVYTTGAEPVVEDWAREHAQEHLDSAAVSAAADPSPTDSFTVPRAVSDEGSGGDSDILPSPPPERFTDCPCWVGHGDCGGCSGVIGISHEPACGWEWDPNCPQHADLIPVPPVVAGESPRGVSTDQPSLGEPNLTHPDPAEMHLWPDSLLLTFAANSLLWPQEKRLSEELLNRAAQFAVLEEAEK